MRYLSSVVFVLCVYVNPGERGDPGTSELRLLGDVCVCYIHWCTYYVFMLPQVEGEMLEKVRCTYCVLCVLNSLVYLCVHATPGGGGNLETWNR